MQQRFIRTRAKGGVVNALDAVDETSQKIYTLNAISASISREANLDKVLRQSLRWVLEAIDTDAGAIFLYDEETRQLQLAAHHGLSDRFIAEHRSLGYRDGLSSVVLRSGKPLVVTDVQADRRILPSTAAEGISSMAGVPLRSDNKVVGVMNVLSHTHRNFTQGDVELLLSIGNQIGVAIAKAQLRSAETESREQLRQKMNQLQELLKVSATFRANAPLDQVLNAICSAISSALGFRLVELNLLDESGYMVPTAFSGFTPEERQRLKGNPRPPEFYEWVMQPKFRMSTSYFVPHQENPYDASSPQWSFIPDIDDAERGEDEWHQMDALAVPMHDRDGALVGMVYVDDPVDRKRPSLEQVQVLEMFVQQAALAVENSRLLSGLQASEAKYRLVTEAASDLIFLLDPDGTIVFMSSSAKQILGYKPDELVGKKLSDLMAPTSRRLAPSYLLNPGMTQELNGRFEVEVYRADGSSTYLEINSTPVFDSGKLSGEQGIARDVTEKKRMEREIMLRQRQLRKSQKREEQLTGYAATVINAQEEERKRIARDLHDDTAQALIALSRRLEALGDAIHTDPERADQMLDDLKSLTDQTLASVRRFSRDLRPSVLDDLGLVPALEWLVSENARRYKITTRLKVQGDARRLPPEVELACFRIAQEALNNTAKHAEATGAAVELHFGKDWCRLVVSDNGQGFEAPTSISDLAGRGRMGVMGMHERAALLGGNLTLKSTPGEGTRISVTLPVGE